MTGRDHGSFPGWLIARRPSSSPTPAAAHSCSLPALSRMSASDAGMVLVCGRCEKPWELLFDGRGVMVWQPVTRRSTRAARSAARKGIRRLRSGRAA